MKGSDFFRKRIFTFLFIFTVPFVSAQISDKISITEDNISVRQALSRIEEQTGYTFAYNRTRFDTDRRISLRAENLPVSAVISQILAGSGYAFTVKGKQIVIAEVKSEPQSVVNAHVPSDDYRQPEVLLEDARRTESLPLVSDKMYPDARFDGSGKTIEPFTGVKTFGSMPTIPYPKPDKNGPFVAIKTNALYWLTTTPNLGLEIALGDRMTLDIQGGYNPWMFGNKQANRKLKHWVIQPEFRLWTSEKFNGGFFGFHLMYGEYNAGGINIPLDIIHDLSTSRYRGSAIGGGFSYGYQWYMSPHWNLEATFGFGYLFLDYKKYECARCGKLLDTNYKHYFGPTKVGVSFIYLIKSKK